MPWIRKNEVSCTELVGKLFISATATDNKLVLVDSENIIYTFVHEQECCEEVYIESIVGDINVLINEPLIECEEVVSQNDLNDEASETYTFYKFRTLKGYITIRWYGTGNGYYSESVKILQTNK